MNNGTAPVTMRDDWFDRLAKRSVTGMTRRDAVGWLGGTTALAFLGKWVKPPRVVSAVSFDQDPCPKRTFYTEQCGNPVPKLNYKPPVNGCGPQQGFDVGVTRENLVNPVPQRPLYMTSFTPACDGHDRGYSTCNRPKEDTDTQFLNDMKAICSKEYSLDTFFGVVGYMQCTRNAEIYWAAVSLGGDEPYKDGQKNACDCCEECPGGAVKCKGECCRKGWICGSSGLCCQPCDDGWIRCPYPNNTRCGFGCCMPGSPICCPGMQPGSLRCCNGKCYKGGCG